MSTPRVPWGEAFRVWMKIGLLSFGGPAGQIALMHRVLVDEKKWVDENRFLHALNFCMILPGPEAQQLATYTGWLLHGVRGGLVAGILFILPGFVVILGLSSLYVAAGRLPLMQGLLLGLKSAVIAIVLEAVVRIGRRSLKTRLLIGLAAAAFVAIFVFHVPFPLIVASAAGFGFALIRSQASHDLAGNGAATVDPVGIMGTSAVGFRSTLGVTSICLALWMAPVVLAYFTLGGNSVFVHIGTFFSKMAIVTFGGAYAVLAYVAQEAVQVHGWLAPGEMIDGLAMAETTPGPLIMVVQFVGFVAAHRSPGALSPGLAAFLGAVLTTWVTFVPCFLWIFAGAPHIESLRRNRFLTGALSAVTAAVVGVIINLALWFSIHALFTQTRLFETVGMRFDLPVLSSIRWPAMFMTAFAVILVLRLRASVPLTLGISAALGILAQLFLS